MGLLEGTGFGWANRGAIELVKLGLVRLVPLTMLELSILDVPNNLLRMSGRSDVFLEGSFRGIILFSKKTK